MLKEDKEGVIPLSKEMKEQLDIWYNNINLKIDLAKEIERLNNIINELEKYINNQDNWMVELGYKKYEPFIEVKKMLDKLNELKEEE